MVADGQPDVIGSIPYIKALPRVRLILLAATPVTQNAWRQK